MRNSLNTDFNRWPVAGWLLAIVMALSYNIGFSQVTSTNNNNAPIGLNNFLGWNPSVNSDLEVWHNNINQSIVFRTNGVERMRIRPEGIIAVNTINSGNARFHVLHNVTGGIATQGLVSNIDGNNLNTVFSSILNTGNFAFGITANTAGTFGEVDMALRGIADGENDVYGIYASTSGNGVPNDPNRDAII